MTERIVLTLGVTLDQVQAFEADLQPLLKAARRGVPVDFRALLDRYPGIENAYSKGDFDRLLA